MKSTEHESNTRLSVSNCRGFETEEKGLILFDFGIQTAWDTMKAVVSGDSSYEFVGWRPFFHRSKHNV